MFERFTKDAREVVIEAQRDAAETGAQEVTPLHLLTAMLRTQESSATRLLARIGVPPADVAAEAGRVQRRGGISEADAEALGEFGIDVDRIVARIEEAHGPDALSGKGKSRPGKHIRFADASKKTLELCLKEVVRMGGKSLGAEHILLALAVQRGPAADVLARFDVDAARLRAALP
ncbi:ATP-dependent Clp protease ATP-binding subunit ClpA [Amycolatopsis bartoniae]|uniref:ATPase n=1 Tax=Amycolatopsis bartoniae TaxID=941986 RepID=A0A8H9MFN9_9PSEU|nr:Clp protease N-terminal domain-containing protein [Amycolatopsis bartoniae]MBB2933585.1 ATP-dependent Clp protease ATP-binding subunit ClpA [Amycolatopsis bartoniae]TVT10764.1 ATPase [Amycolatopsis bartoniae]GHF73107.1 ATPase [Amycolatopsis bartoniae]